MALLETRSLLVAQEKDCAEKDHESKTVVTPPRQPTSISLSTTYFLPRMSHLSPPRNFGKPVPGTAGSQIPGTERTIAESTSGRIGAAVGLPQPAAAAVAAAAEPEGS